MNAVEIADAVSQLAEKAFDQAEFPFEFLAAFGNKDTTLARLRKGDTNASDVGGGVLQKNNIHIAVCELGRVGETLGKLRSSPKSATAKVKFILATGGATLEAEELKTGETVASDYPALADHFGFFLPLAGISTVREIKENPIDVRATGRLNKLYIELLRTNEDWQTAERRTDLNHFFARLIFCFFGEDTRIFDGDGMFTDTVTRMSEADGSNVDFVLGWLFKAMNLSLDQRKSVNVPDRLLGVAQDRTSPRWPRSRIQRPTAEFLFRKDTFRRQCAGCPTRNASRMARLKIFDANAMVAIFHGRLVPDPEQVRAAVSVITRMELRARPGPSPIERVFLDDILSHVDIIQIDAQVELLAASPPG